MQEMVDLVVSNGIGVACILYFMWRDAKFMTTLTTTLVQLNDTIQVVKELVEDKEGGEK